MHHRHSVRALALPTPRTVADILLATKDTLEAAVDIHEALVDILAAVVGIFSAAVDIFATVVGILAALADFLTTVAAASLEQQPPTVLTAKKRSWRTTHE